MILIIITSLTVVVAVALSAVFISDSIFTEVVWTGRHDVKGRKVYDIRHACYRDTMYRYTAYSVPSFMLQAGIVCGVIATMLVTFMYHRESRMVTAAVGMLSVPGLKKLFRWTESLSTPMTKVKVRVAFKAWWGVVNNPNMENYGEYDQIVVELPEQEETTISVEGSLADTLKVDPQVLRICMPKEPTESLDQICDVFGLDPEMAHDEEGKLMPLYRECFTQKWKEQVDPKTNEKLRVKDDEGFDIPVYTPKSIGSLTEDALYEVAIRTIDRHGYLDENDVLPAHPKHILAGCKNDIYILLKGYGRSFDKLMDRCLVVKDRLFRNSIFIRFGKDFLSLPVRIERVIKGIGEGVSDIVTYAISEKRILRVLLRDKVPHCHDGNAFLRAGVGQPEGGICLVRAIPVTVDESGMPNGFSIGKAFFLLKCRMITFTDGNLYDVPKDFRKLPDNVDAVTTLDNTKWLPKDHDWKDGDIVNVLTVFSKNESTEPHEKYNFNLLSLLMGHWTPASYDKLFKMFKQKFGQVAKRLANPDKKFEHTLRDAMQNKSEDALGVCETKAKQYVGFANSKERCELWAKEIETCKSVLLDAHSPCLIHATEWFGVKIKPGEFLCSAESGEWLVKVNRFNGRITILRQPVSSHQSFQSVKHAGLAVLLPGRIFVYHPGLEGEAASALSSDGDDKLMATAEVDTTFDPGKPFEPIVKERNAVDLGFDFPRLLLYFKGMIAQSSIGSTFNQMAQCLAFFKDNGWDPKPVYDIFGRALEQFAQGIKKNIKTPTKSELSEYRDHFCGGNPKWVKDCDILDETVELGNFVAMIEIYLLDIKLPGSEKGSRTPATICKLIKQVWDVDMPSYIPRKERVLKRTLVGASDDMRVSLERHIANRDEKNPVAWVITLSKWLDQEIGNFRELKIIALGGDNTAFEKLVQWIDCYAYVAYKLHIMLSENTEAVDELLLLRLEKMNGLTILASQMVDDIVPEDPKGSLASKLPKPNGSSEVVTGTSSSPSKKPAQHEVGRASSNPVKGTENTKTQS